MDLLRVRALVGALAANRQTAPMGGGGGGVEPIANEIHEPLMFIAVSSQIAFDKVVAIVTSRILQKLLVGSWDTGAHYRKSRTSSLTISAPSWTPSHVNV